MSRGFRRGIAVGFLAPVAFVGGLVYWVYRFTSQVPFPTRRSDDGEVVVKLVDLDQVPRYWQQWKEGLEPIISRVHQVVETAKTERDRLVG